MRKWKIYIAAPLFNDMERVRNTEMKVFIQKLGFEVFLPQDDVGLSYDMITRDTKMEVRKALFESDIQGLRESDIVLILLDGRTPDEGACIELGMGWALGKKCVGYKTDNRAMDVNGDNNIMIDGCLSFRFSKDLVTLKAALLEVIKEQTRTGGIV